MVAADFVRCRRVTPHNTCASEVKYSFTAESVCFAANLLGLSFFKSKANNLCTFSKGLDLVHLTAVSDVVPIAQVGTGASVASLSQSVIQGRADANSISVVALFDAVQIQRLIPAGVTTASTYEAVILALPSQSRVHGARASWANILKAIVTLSFGDGRNSPYVPFGFVASN